MNLPTLPHRRRSRRQRPTVPALHRVLAEAACATTATEYAALTPRIAEQHGPILAAEIIGAHWPLCVGRKCMHRALASLIDFVCRDKAVDSARARRLVGLALMTPDERAAHRIVMRQQSHRLYALTDFTRATGWFRLSEEARAMWTRTKPPLAARTLDIRSADILAVEFSARGFWELVPVPGADRNCVEESL